MNKEQAFRNVFRNTLIFVLLTHLLLAIAIIFEWFGPAEGVGGNFCEGSIRAQFGSISYSPLRKIQSCHKVVLVYFNSLQKFLAKIHAGIFLIGG